MAAPAAALGAEAAAQASQQASSMLKTVLDALNKNVLSFHFEKNPRRVEGPLILKSVDINISTGLILGAAGLAIVWEAGNWFANALAKWNGGDGLPAELGLSAILGPAGLVVTGLTDLLGNPIIDPQTGQQKTVQAPASFGAAYNQMLRNFTVSLPGTLAQKLVNLVGNYTTGGGPGQSTAAQKRTAHEGRAP